MNFIEQLLGISPDNGTGLTELAIGLVWIAIIGIGYLLRVRRSRRDLR
jgi:hypothetical protein